MITTATNKEELAHLVSLVHDQWADTDDLQITDGGDLILPMLIEEDQPILVSPGWWKSKFIVPRRKACLKIANVIEHMINDRALIGGMKVRDIRLDDGLSIIEGCEPVIMRVRVHNLYVTLDVLEEVADEVVRWVNRLGWQTTSYKNPVS